MSFLIDLLDGHYATMRRPPHSIYRLELEGESMRKTTANMSDQEARK